MLSGAHIAMHGPVHINYHGPTPETTAEEHVEEDLRPSSVDTSILYRSKEGPGWVYLTKPGRKCSGCNNIAENEYKLGKTQQSKPQDRMSAYGADRKDQLRIHVPMASFMEDRLIEAFTNRFQVSRGREYFTGDIRVMKEVFAQTFLKFQYVMDEAANKKAVDDLFAKAVAAERMDTQKLQEPGGDEAASCSDTHAEPTCEEAWPHEDSSIDGETIDDDVKTLYIPNSRAKRVGGMRVASNSKRAARRTPGLHHAHYGV